MAVRAVASVAALPLFDGGALGDVVGHRVIDAADRTLVDRDPHRRRIAGCPLAASARPVLDGSVASCLEGFPMRAKIDPGWSSDLRP